MWEPTFAQGYSQNGGRGGERGWEGGGADTVACLSSTPTYLSLDVSKAAPRSPHCDLHTTTDVLHEVTSEHLLHLSHDLFCR